MGNITYLQAGHYLTYVDAVIAFGRRHSTRDQLDFGDNIRGGMVVGLKVYDKDTKQLLFETEEEHIGDRAKPLIEFKIIGGRVTPEMIKEVKLELAGQA